MDIEILSTELLKPSLPTPHHQKNHKVSLLDQVFPSVYVPVTLFYTNFDHHGSTRHLKNSLSETLTRFYPFAGRARDMIFIDCTDEGIIYKEAQVHCQLSEFLEKPEIDLLSDFLPCKLFYKLQFSDPLFGVQISTFDCGGIVIGICFSHRIADARSIGTFLNDWAMIASARTNKHVHPDFTTASTLFPTRDPSPDWILDTLESLLTDKRELTSNRFVFNENSLGRLKSKVASETNPNPSRVQALTALIWDRFIASLTALQGPSRTHAMTHAVNLRRRLDPPISEYVVGNVIWAATGLYNPPQEYSSEEHLPMLGDIVKEALENMDSDSVMCLQGEEGFDIIESSVQNLVLLREEVKDGVCRFTSWCNMGLYEVDFGWGKPIWVALLGKVDGRDVLTKAGIVFVENGHVTKDGIEVWMTLPKDQMDIVIDDSKFLEFASLNPSVLTG